MNRPKDTAAETVPLSRASRDLLGGAARGAPAMELVVYHRDGAVVRELHPGTPLVIGREAPADVQIADRSLSRQHARIVLQDGALAVEDLDSTNGTLLRGKTVARAAFRPGEPVKMGDVTALVQVYSALEPGAQGLAGHDHFCELLDRELERARYFDERFSLLMVRAADGNEHHAHVGAWCQRLRSLLRPVDVMALYSERAVEILLPRATTTEAAQLARAASVAARPGCALCCGVASFPGAARSGVGLLQMCVEAARAATLASPVRCVGDAGSYSRVIATASDDNDDQVVAVSTAMVSLLATVDRLAGSTIPVLLVGETGTGKEVIAHAIHRRGPRSVGPMVCVNCGAIPAQLVESTLFGHQRGAFTGADQASPGVFGTADGGTVLLDEISELPPTAQTALLRVLESGRITAVGAAREIEVDVRVLAATNRDLDRMCEQGTFRLDLLYRLNAMTLLIPPLRARVEEVAIHAHRFLKSATRSTGRALEGISAEALSALEDHHWPGNLRELRNAIERAVVIARGTRIEVDDLPLRVRRSVASPAAGSALDPSARDGASDPDDEAGLALKTRVRRYEARLIVRALAATGGNRTQAARLLQVPLRTLVHKIKMHGIAKHGDRRGG